MADANVNEETQRNAQSSGVSGSALSLQEYETLKLLLTKRLKWLEAKPIGVYAHAYDEAVNIGMEIRMLYGKAQNEKLNDCGEHGKVTP